MFKVHVKLGTMPHDVKMISRIPQVGERLMYRDRAHGSKWHPATCREIREYLKDIPLYVLDMR